MTGFAITYTIKDEARLLPDALAWHRMLGCKRFYIFLDGTSDAMRDFLPTQDDVVLAPSVDPHQLANPPAWITWARANHHGWMDVRKKLNIWSATRDAHAAGFDWIGVIDPDELILPPDSDRLERPDALRWLAAVPSGIDQLLLPNLDVLAAADDGQSPFAKRHFLNRLGRTETSWRLLRRVVSRILRKPQLVAWFDHWFFTLALGANPPRVLRDPASSKIIPFGYFLSYSNYKAIFRCARYASFDPQIHRWVAPRRFAGSPRAITSGNVLHYDMIDAAHFRTKFGQRRGQQEFELNLFYARWKLGQMAISLSAEHCDQFFRESLSIRDETRLADLVGRGLLREIEGPAALFGQGLSD
jgi:Glycosyl transferase family 2